jgi:hypothetical protein
VFLFAVHEPFNLIVRATQFVVALLTVAAAKRSVCAAMPALGCGGESWKRSDSLHRDGQLVYLPSTISPTHVSSTDEQTIPTERPPLVGEVSADFCGWRVLRGQRSRLQIQRSGFDSRRYQIFCEVLGLERGPLSLVSTIEELLERKSSDSSLENREYGRGDPSP